ncbi:unnamed protein product [Spirodela intermedia]|uniref:Reverse transcriptase Ty1/copia-type domain-containing protein n=2 Tax=Spirodela intermedia TaxID=51605 RepID=A0A7I8IEF5_SPIIN|nr:unnamed protein product [Spirodela intermedia]CAA6656059.1 unnamed protein product [Spirodela intermedia]CAA7391497.1 unnamed protein product [Spirodela intermedia]
MQSNNRRTLLISGSSLQETWRKAMEEEIAAIMRNHTWILTPATKNCKPIGLKWIFKIKRNSQGKIIRHKAKLVAKGYVQKLGIDYEEVFAPVARMEIVRVIISLAAQNGWRLHHLDVKLAFLNRELEEEVFVKQPEGCIHRGKENYVYKLKKALYGLK